MGRRRNRTGVFAAGPACRLAQGLLLALVLWLGALPARAEPDPAAAARAAAERIEAASRALEDASGASNRIAALTETVRAFEEGLAAMRSGLRRVSIREQVLARDLDAREQEISRLLAALQMMGRNAGPLVMLHPLGPTGTARSGMILADVTPALSSEAERLAADLREVAELRALQENAAETLREGLAGIQAARSELSLAASERRDLPRRFVEDPIRTAILIASTETLEGFASGLSEIVGEELMPYDPPVLTSGLRMPVQGTLLRGFREPDAAGVARPGLIMATAPRALVTAPAAATIRYRGPLLDYGNLLILEPAADMLVVLAGLAEVYGEIGQVVPEGAPLGLMGGVAPEHTELTAGDAVPSRRRSESLYIEVRVGQEPVNPGDWFVFDTAFNGD